jgi:phosphatidylserine decarboxylase
MLDFSYISIVVAYFCVPGKKKFYKIFEINANLLLPVFGNFLSLLLLFCLKIVDECRFYE